MADEDLILSRNETTLTERFFETVGLDEPIDGPPIRQELEIKKIRLNRVSEISREVLGRSSLHGFAVLVGQLILRPVKIFWLVCIVASWSYFMYQVYNTIVLYGSYPKITQIMMVKNPVIDFPGKLP